jgi:hypothetical protein
MKWINGCGDTTNTHGHAAPSFTTCVIRGKTDSHDVKFRVLTEFVRPLPGYRVNPPGGMRTRGGNWAISHAFHEADDSRMTRQIGSMEKNFEESYANSLAQPPVPRLRSAPIPEVAYEDHPYDRKITSTLLARLRDVRVVRCVELYAREHVGNSVDRDILAIREETIPTHI